MTDRDIAALRRQWDANPFATHHRPPFRAHQFDAGDVAAGRWFVVGSTTVACHPGPAALSSDDAHRIAAILNGAA